MAVLQVELLCCCCRILFIYLFILKYCSCRLSMCVAGFFAGSAATAKPDDQRSFFILFFVLHLPSRQRYGYGMSARTLTCRISYIGIFLPEAQHIPMQIHQTLYHRSMVILTWNRNGRTWRLERSRLLISLSWSFPSPTHSLDFFFYSSPVFVEGMHSTMAICVCGVEAF